MVSYFRTNTLISLHLTSKTRSTPIEWVILTDKNDDLVDYNEVDLNGNPIPKPNEGDEDPPSDQGWTFDEEQTAQFRAKFGDETYYEPYNPKPPRGSVEDIQHRLRITGIRLRKELNRSLLTDPDK